MHLSVMLFLKFNCLVLINLLYQHCNLKGYSRLGHMRNKYHFIDNFPSIALRIPTAHNFTRDYILDPRALVFHREKRRALGSRMA